MHVDHWNIECRSTNEIILSPSLSPPLSRTHGRSRKSRRATTPRTTSAGAPLDDESNSGLSAAWSPIRVAWDSCPRKRPTRLRARSVLASPRLPTRPLLRLQAAWTLGRERLPTSFPCLARGPLPRSDGPASTRERRHGGHASATCSRSAQLRLHRQLARRVSLTR